MLDDREEQPRTNRWWVWLVVLAVLAGMIAYAVVATHGIHPGQPSWVNP